MKTTKLYGKKVDLALSMWVKLTRAHDTFNHLAAANIRSFGLTPAQFGAIECLGHLVYHAHWRSHEETSCQRRQYDGDHR